MAESLPITCTATMVSASAWVGFTFPGMIDEPGSFSGMISSPIPHLGPDASSLTSFAIFNRSAASAFIAPWTNTISSLLVRAWNLFSAVTNLCPDFLEISSATFTA